MDSLERAVAVWAARQTEEERDDAAPVSAEPADSLVSVGSAAALLGLSARRVQELAAAGLLDGRRAGRVWLLDRSSVELLRDERRTA